MLPSTDCLSAIPALVRALSLSFVVASQSAYTCATTGKTTVAQIYGRILRALGLLSNGSVVLKSGGDLISGHEGGTEEATLAILENAKGKVLVIDEAYMLDSSNYGKIALDMIVSKVMGSPGEDIAVLLLGYEDLIMKMLNNQNPGLKRYFT